MYLAPDCETIENKAFVNGGGARSGGKPSSGGDGKVIRIINADEQSIRERVLLNLKTTQPFEEVHNVVFMSTF